MREYHDGIEGLVLILIDRIKLLNQYNPKWESENYRDANVRYLEALRNLYRELFWVHGGIGDPGEPNDDDAMQTLRWLIQYQSVYMGARNV